MRKAGDIISALFANRFGPEFMENARSAAGLFSSWTRIVTEVWPAPAGGDREKDDVPAAAAHSRIRELEKGLLLVEADHPGWIQVLQMKQTELLAVVRRRYPNLEIRGIAFRLSREPGVSRPEAAESSAGAPGPAEPWDENSPPVSERRSGEREQGIPRDEEFYAALKELEKTVRERNRS